MYIYIYIFFFSISFIPLPFHTYSLFLKNKTLKLTPLSHPPQTLTCDSSIILTHNPPHPSSLSIHHPPHCRH